MQHRSHAAVVQHSSGAKQQWRCTSVVPCSIGVMQHRSHAAVVPCSNGPTHSVAPCMYGYKHPVIFRKQIDTEAAQRPTSTPSCYRTLRYRGARTIADTRKWAPSCTCAHHTYTHYIPTCAHNTYKHTHAHTHTHTPAPKFATTTSRHKCTHITPLPACQSTYQGTGSPGAPQPAPAAASR
eukprot:scaffold65789_cov23-Tisochrysis_lutea.AAC.1